MHRLYTPLLLLLGSVSNSATAMENERHSLLADVSSSPAMTNYGSSSSIIVKEEDELLPNARMCACAVASSRIKRTSICALLLAGLTSLSLLSQCPVLSEQKPSLRLPIAPASEVARVDLDISNTFPLENIHSNENSNEVIFRTKPVAFGLWDKIAQHKEHAMDIYFNNDESPCYHLTPLSNAEYQLSDSLTGQPLLRLVQVRRSTVYTYQSLSFQIQRFDTHELVYKTLYDVVVKDTWGDISFILASDERLDAPSVVAIPVGGGNQKLGYELKVMGSQDTFAVLTGTGDFTLFPSRAATVNDCVYVGMAKILELYTANSGYVD